jgi:hypothetical protein
VIFVAITRCALGGRYEDLDVPSYALPGFAR